MPHVHGSNARPKKVYRKEGENLCGEHEPIRENGKSFLEPAATKRVSLGGFPRSRAR